MDHNRPELELEAQRILIERYSPVGFLVDERLKILSFFGDTSPYLRPAPGPPVLNLARMVHPKLLPHLEAVVNASASAGCDTHHDGIEFPNRDRINIQVIPVAVSTSRETGFLILLQPAQRHGELPARRPEDEWGRLRREAELMRNSVASLAERRYKAEADVESARIQLDQTRKELRDTVAQMIKNDEEARQAIARDLHDVFSQKIASVGMELDRIVPEARQASEQLAGQIESVKEQLDEFADQLHQLSRQLHPSIVLQIGLPAAIQNECARWSSEHSVMLDCIIENPPESLPESTAIALYRVAQEALTNIAKHSGASRARLRLEGQDRNIRLRVEDFGKGFQSEIRPWGLGLITMRERIAAAGGWFQIESNPGRGTVVQAEIPLT